MAKVSTITDGMPFGSQDTFLFSDFLSQILLASPLDSTPTPQVCFGQSLVSGEHPRKMIPIYSSQPATEGRKAKLFLKTWLLTPHGGGGRKRNPRLISATVQQQRQEPYAFLFLPLYVDYMNNLNSCINMSSRQQIYEKRHLANDESNDFGEMLLSASLAHVSRLCTCLRHNSLLDCSEAQMLTSAAFYLTTDGTVTHTSQTSCTVMRGRDPSRFLCKYLMDHGS